VPISIKNCGSFTANNAIDQTGFKFKINSISSVLLVKNLCIPETSSKNFAQTLFYLDEIKYFDTVYVNNINMLESVTKYVISVT
jgi:hypothetical protein